MSSSSSLWPRQTWTFANPNPATVQSLQNALPNLSKILATALASRGIQTPTQAKEFLAPNLTRLVSPDLIPGIPQATEIIHRAIANHTPIVVFGDYDADGISATTILVTALEALGANVKPFFPSRIHEGYGFTNAAIQRLFKEDPQTRLVITVDSGIAQHDGTRLCHQLGATVIITDHHTIPATLPEADAIVHPNLPGAPQATQHLCGAGIAFEIAYALSRGPNETRLFDLKPLLPLVALATVADIVPLVDENRLLVAAGLAAINKKLSPGLQALIQIAGIRPPIDSSHIGFQLGPRINAAGRIGDPKDAYHLLHARSIKEAQPYAEILHNANIERQTLTSNAYDEVSSDLTFAFTPDTRCIVAHNPDWHPGIVGLIAGKLTETYSLPSVIFHSDPSSGIARGSARCPNLPGLNLMQLFETCREHILQFGGHAAAGGLSIELNRLPDFKAAFQHACAAALPELLRPEILIDGWVSPSDLTRDFHLALSRLQPFGQANPELLWACHDLVLSADPKTIGSDGNHRQLFFKRLNDTPLKASFFNVGPTGLPWHEGDHVDVVFTTSLNYFFDEHSPSLELQIKDIRPAT